MPWGWLLFEAFVGDFKSLGTDDLLSMLLPSCWFVLFDLFS